MELRDEGDYLLVQGQWGKLNGLYVFIKILRVWANGVELWGAWSQRSNFQSVLCKYEVETVVLIMV